MDTSDVVGTKKRQRVLISLWLSAPLVFTIFRFSGGQILDGFMGLYYNQPWHDVLLWTGGIVLIISIIASITLMTYFAVDKRESFRPVVVGFIASLCLPIVLSYMALLHTPIHFEPSTSAVCARGNEALA
ncbi:MAG: hypothetical protein ABIP74_02590, partial [Candidatus Saccharimonas sp.]